MSIPSQQSWTTKSPNAAVPFLGAPQQEGGNEKRPVISIVIPVLNEAEHLRNSLEVIRTHATALGVAFEIIVVDDGSQDATWQVLQQLADELNELRCLAFSRNFGKEAAMLAGLEAALGDAVILMDCDLQHPPELIPEMVRLWRDQGYQVVNAVKRQRGRESMVAKAGSRIFYRLFEGLTRTRLAGSSDFKLLDREVIDAYTGLRERNLFFRGLVPWMGFAQVDLPFEVQPRAGGDSKWSVFKLMCLAIHGIVSFSSVPLHLVTLSGLLFLLFATGLGAQTLYVKATGGAVEGFTTVIILILFVSSILMLSLGVIGEYLAKIYDELKQRPRYLVRSRIRVGDLERCHELQSPQSR